MRGLGVVGLVVACLVVAPLTASAESEAVLVGGTAGAVVGAALLTTTVGGSFIETLPMGVVPGVMSVGVYLEATRSCASRGLEPYTRQYTSTGNRGFVNGRGDGTAAEEQVKWEVGAGRFMQPRCERG